MIFCQLRWRMEIKWDSVVAYMSLEDQINSIKLHLILYA